MRTNPALDDWVTVRLTLSEWIAVVVALEELGLERHAGIADRIEAQVRP